MESKDPYFLLFNCVTDVVKLLKTGEDLTDAFSMRYCICVAIEQLKDAQKAAEEMYLEMK